MRLCMMLAGFLAATTSCATTDSASQPTATVDNAPATDATREIEETPADLAAAHFQALEKSVDDAVNAWRKGQQDAAKKAQEAAASGGSIPAMSMVPPFGKFVPEFQAAAKQFAGQEGALPFLLWLLQFGFADPEVVATAATTLIEQHLESAELTQLAQILPHLEGPLGAERVASMLDVLLKKSPHATVRGWVVVATAGTALEDPQLAVGSPEYNTAKARLQKAGDASGDPELAGRITGLIAGREQLVDGQLAPDIAGVDLDGVAFKLSDYAGKIVLLDFWGDW